MKEPPTQLSDATEEGLEPNSGRLRERERYLLWVDGVGGFLICLAPRVLLGHGATENDVDIPILADVARKHAWLERDSQGYLVESLRPVQIHQASLASASLPHSPASPPRQRGENASPASAQAVAGKALIRHGDLITLGRSCQFAFAQAVPVSASARLDLVSGHRLWRALHGVLLMAETLVFGPGPAVHVLVAELPEPLVLFRQKAGLAVHYPGKLLLNGQPVSDRCSFEAGTRITAEDVSLSLERIGGP